MLQDLVTQIRAGNPRELAGQGKLALTSHELVVFLLGLLLGLHTQVIFDEEGVARLDA